MQWSWQKFTALAFRRHSGCAVRSMFALLVAASGIDVSNPTVTYGPGLTMAPGYINYSNGFIDWWV